MPTITKPKRVSDPYMVPVQIRKSDRDLIFDCVASVDPENSKAFETFIHGLEQLLTFNFNKLRRSLEAPLPAHIAAALAPIGRRAGELADLLTPNNLPTAVLRELGVDEVSDGQAWNLLTKIRVSAEVATERLKQQKSSGMHVARYNDQRYAALNHLGQHYMSYRPMAPDDDSAEYVGARTEFLSICQNYLPKLPGKGKSRSNK